MSEKLPPGTRCVVCDDIATGNHYSVPSCNGCKTFFRRALVNNRQFTCSGNGNCPVNKGVRCACRYCRLQKCLQVGMDKNAIQSDRDRIGYTKRTRKPEKNRTPSLEPDDQETRYSSGDQADTKDFKPDGGFGASAVDPILERLTTLENNFTLLLSRGEIDPYDSLDAALNAPSRFSTPVNIRTFQLNDPIAYTNSGKEQQPFWRSRIIALYIDWAKTFSCFRKLPYSDKVALINNHASSYLIMCEVFRTPEHIEELQIEDCLTKVIHTPGGSSTLLSVVLNNDVARSFANALEMKTKVKREPSDTMIRLPTEYGSLPPEYGHWIPQDYGTPVAGTEGRPDMHKLFNNCMPTASTSECGNGISHRGSHLNRNVSPSELTPVMAAMIDYMMKPFRQLNISTTEFAALQAVMFFDPDTEGLDAASQRNIEAEQQRLLTALHRHLQKHYSGIDANERYANILLRIPTIRKVAAKKNESLQMIDMLNLFSLNSLVKETALGTRATRSTNSAHFE